MKPCTQDTLKVLQKHKDLFKKYERSKTYVKNYYNLYKTILEKGYSLSGNKFSLIVF